MVRMLKRFKALIASGRLAHAYLFVGPVGVGKSETALAVTKMVNCEDHQQAENGFYCGKCPSCLKVDYPRN